MLNFFRKPKTQFKHDIKADDQILISLLDSQLGTFGPPKEGNLEDIKESLVMLFRDEKQQNNLLVKYADKYTAYSVGSWNKKTGTLQGHEPRLLFNLADLK